MPGALKAMEIKQYVVTGNSRKTVKYSYTVSSIVYILNATIMISHYFKNAIT